MWRPGPCSPRLHIPPESRPGYVDHCRRSRTCAPLEASRCCDAQRSQQLLSSLVKIFCFGSTTVISKIRKVTQSSFDQSVVRTDLNSHRAAGLNSNTMADQIYSIKLEACGNEELEGHYTSRIGHDPPAGSPNTASSIAAACMNHCCHTHFLQRLPLMYSIHCSTCSNSQCALVQIYPLLFISSPMPSILHSNAACHWRCIWLQV